MLSLDEIERAAYANGDVHTSRLLAIAEESAAESFYDTEDKIREEAFSEGHANGTEEALDRDLAQELEDAQTIAACQKVTITVLKDAMKRLEAELVGDGCKTVVGRKNLAKALQTMRYARGLF